jgi:hypothetical protein
MAVFKYSQTPLEQKIYTVDYSDWLSTGEMINFATINVAPVTTPPFVVSNLAYSTDRTQLSFYASGGQDGERYTAEIIMTTTLQQTKDDHIIYAVKEPR